MGRSFITLDTFSCHTLNFKSVHVVFGHFIDYPVNYSISVPNRISNSIECSVFNRNFRICSKGILVVTNGPVREEIKKDVNFCECMNGMSSAPSELPRASSSSPVGPPHITGVSITTVTQQIEFTFHA